MRSDGRAFDELRKVEIIRNYIKPAEGSVFISMGDTKIICTASIEEKVPPFQRNTGKGWITGEYSMLPRATQMRTIREASKGRLSGRTMEIQRLIGRSLRSVVDLRSLGERTLWIDCDVIQADGGTRTTAITGSFVAMVDALISLAKKRKLPRFPVREFLAATSLGIIGKEVCLDLCYEEDVQALVDLNLVMTGTGKVVEIQGTAENAPFSLTQLSQMIEVGQKGIDQLISLQKKLLAEQASWVGKN